MPWVIYGLSPKKPRHVDGPSGRRYQFQPSGINNWGMEDVDEQDLDTVLNAKRGCCGKGGKHFRLATPEEIEAWEQNTVYHRRR
jgi:hypothetical protein